MKIFSWGATWYSANAQKVGEELEIIERDNVVTPEHVVEYAQRHKDSELYKCFEWNDTDAAKRWRLNQARLIISSITIEIIEKPKKVQRVYVNVKDTETEKKVFKNINEVLKNDKEYQQLIEKAKRDIESCKEKYEDLIEKEDLKDLIFEIYRSI